MAAMRRRPREGVQEVVSDTFSRPLSLATEKCAVCLKPFHPKRIVNDTSRRRRFCSSRCRTVWWGLQALRRELEAGNAEGIREAVQNLSRSAG
jgi:hypothetical protein